MSQSLRRKMVQAAVSVFTNFHVANFMTGKIYKGDWKSACVPSLNCYSCPGAVFSCPLGALQAVAGAPGHRFSFYAAGFLLAVGTMMGRAVCAFFCPFGLFQELLYKVPVPKMGIWKRLAYLKYVLLLVFVLFLPMTWRNYADAGAPAYCEYICPAGTLEGGLPLLVTHPEFRQALGMLFAWKLTVLLLVLFGSMVHYRFFCKILCPLGAIYGLLNRISVYRLHVDQDRCVNCGRCGRSCRMGVDPLRHPDAAECIRCGECVTACPKGAISMKADLIVPWTKSHSSMRQKQE